MKIHTIIIDDEPLAREGIKSYIKQVSYLVLTGAFPNPLLAMKKLEKEKVDLMLLDIQMPKLSGIEFLKTLKEPPLVIITTAYPDYAIDGFELDVIDYLLKPISFQKFLKAANKAKSYIDLNRKSENKTGSDFDYFFIKSGNKYEKINFDDVLFMEAAQNYVTIHTENRKYLAYTTLKGLLEKLPEELFVRVQKSYVVSVSKIDSIEGNAVKMGNYSISISRENKESIIKRITSNKLIKR